MRRAATSQYVRAPQAPLQRTCLASLNSHATGNARPLDPRYGSIAGRRRRPLLQGTTMAKQGARRGPSSAPGTTGPSAPCRLQRTGGRPRVMSRPTGAWRDLGRDETAEALDRIRHGTRPAAPGERRGRISGVAPMSRSSPAARERGDALTDETDTSDTPPLGEELSRHARVRRRRQSVTLTAQGVPGVPAWCEAQRDRRVDAALRGYTEAHEAAQR
jgi:hypothetical protein